MSHTLDPAPLSGRKLIARWTTGRSNQGTPDIIYSWPPGRPKADGHYAHTVLTPFVEELKRRGYDETTFRLEITLKSSPKT